MNLLEVIARIREEASTNKERGECFEKIVKVFLKKDPRYREMFSDVWMWDEWPDRKEPGRPLYHLPVETSDNRKC